MTNVQQALGTKHTSKPPDVLSHLVQTEVLSRPGPTSSSGPGPAFQAIELHSHLCWVPEGGVGSGDRSVLCLSKKISSTWRVRFLNPTF